MLTICPLSRVPTAREACIGWGSREWGDLSGFGHADWAGEFDRIHEHPTDEIFVALDDGLPVGMVWMLEHEGIDSHLNLTPWLSCLVVDPAHRARGIGRRLIAHVESYVAAGGDRALYLLTEAPALYFALGWEAIDTAHVAERPVFVMRKALEQPATACRA